MYNARDLEETVIKALQKNYIPVRIMKSIIAEDADGNHIEINPDNYEGQNYLRNGSEFKIAFLQKDLKQLKKVRFEVFDPNTKSL